MGRWNIIFRSLDALTLTGVFLFQNVVLNMILIRSWGGSVYPYFWFLADFMTLSIFYLTLYLVGCHFHREKMAQRRVESASAALSTALQSNGGGGGCGEGSSVDGSSVSAGNKEPLRPTSRNSNNRSYRVSEYNFRKQSCLPTIFTKNFPMAYLCWWLYSGILIAKIVILFRTEIAQGLGKEDFLGPHMLKFAIGISALIFSLIVAAHKNSASDPLRNAFLNNLCYRIALEILDSASFLSLLLPSESHLVYPFAFEEVILILASLNLFLPCMTLYKLCATEFGRKTTYPIETWYKFIHIFLIDGTFLAVRLYLWSMFSADTSIFMIKNIYSLLNFGRELPQDFKDCRTFCCGRVGGASSQDEVEGGGRSRDLDLNLRDGCGDEDDDSVDSTGMIGLRNMNNKERLGGGDRNNGGYNWNKNKKEGSISTRGIHGSAQSSLVQVYAINTEATNGHAANIGAGGTSSTNNTIPPTVAVDDSNSQLDLDEDTTSLVTQADGGGVPPPPGSTSAAAQNQLDDVPVRLRGSSNQH